MSKLLGQIPKLYTSPEIKIDCPDDEKFEIIQELQKRLEGDVPITTIDGVRADFEAGWALVRASNTTPALTARFEATSEKRLDAIRRIMFEHLKTFPQLENLDA